MRVLCTQSSLLSAFYSAHSCTGILCADAVHSVLFDRHFSVYHKAPTIAQILFCYQKQTLPYPSIFFCVRRKESGMPSCVLQIKRFRINSLKKQTVFGREIPKIRFPKSLLLFGGKFILFHFLLPFETSQKSILPLDLLYIQTSKDGF